MKAVKTSHDCQHKLRGCNLLPKFWWHIIPGYSSFRKMQELKGKPAVASRHNVGEMTLIQSLQYWGQLTAFLDLSFSQSVCQLMGDPAQMERFHAACVKQMNQKSRMRNAQSLGK
jgi:hypothetical protein